jgi:flavodoxin/ferredoxin
MNNKNLQIFFFSGTGNTWWVAQQLVNALENEQFQVNAHSIEQVTSAQVKPLIEQSDIVGLGYPIYGSDAPLLMQDFITNLPESKQTKPMLVFVTQAAWSGDGAYFIRPLVEAKGYHIRWAVHFNMPNNITVDLGWILNTFLGFFQAKPATALKRIQKLSQRISQDQNWIMGRSSLFSLGWMQRIPYRKGLPSLQKDSYQVNSERCNACGRCERLCPVKNITLVAGLPRFDTHCNLCLRCFNYCPELAIEAFGKPFNPSWFGEKPYQGPELGFRPELLIRNNYKQQRIE